MWRLLLSLVIGLFVALPLILTAIYMVIEVLRGTAPPVDATTWPTVIGLVLLIFFSSFGSYRLFAKWRATRAPRTETAGFWERFAKEHPATFERAFSINGFGLRYLDFHDRQPDGSGLMTLWITGLFSPIAPIRRERLRAVAQAREGSIPFIASWTTTDVQTLERMPVDRSRNLRVYAFYYGLFWPLIVGPLAAGLAYVVMQRGDVAAWKFWVGVGVYLLWGIGVVALERRVMGLEAATG